MNDPTTTSLERAATPGGSTGTRMVLRCDSNAGCGSIVDVDAQVVIGEVVDGQPFGTAINKYVDQDAIDFATEQATLRLAELLGWVVWKNAASPSGHPLATVCPPCEARRLTRRTP